MQKIIHSARSNKTTPSMIAVGDVIGMLNELIIRDKTIIITDENIHALHPDFIAEFRSVIIPAGESHKNIGTVESIHRQLLEMEAHRDTFLLGIGGGVITDITGFVASTFMRGVEFGFVATTLLSQLDASVGGKNGVNLDGHKNIIGTFNQPDFVLCDISMLKTLPERELRAGMSEAIKCGIIADPALFEIFSKHSFDQIKSSDKLLFDIVSRSVEIKAEIVSKDEREAGLRKLLNLGHTFGHAIEKCTNQYLHGEAVAIGLAKIAEISRDTGKLSVRDYEKIISTLKNLSLPIATQIPSSEIIEAAEMDKKRSGDSIDLVLIEKIGRCKISKTALSEIHRIYN